RRGVDLAGHHPSDQGGNVVASLQAAKRGPTHAPPGDQVARDDVERLATAGDTSDGAQSPTHARGLDRLAHHVDVAGGLERVVRPEAARHPEDLITRVSATYHRVGSAWAACQVEPLQREVDADDPLGSLQAAARDCTETDHPRAEHYAGRAGTHLRGAH